MRRNERSLTPVADEGLLGHGGHVHPVLAEDVTECEPATVAQ